MTTLDLTFRLTLLWKCFQSIIGWLEFNRNHFSMCICIQYRIHSDSHMVWPQVFQLTVWTHTHTPYTYIIFISIFGTPFISLCYFIEVARHRYHECALIHTALSISIQYKTSLNEWHIESEGLLVLVLDLLSKSVTSDTF